MTTVSVHALQIAREIKREGNRRVATFYHGFDFKPSKMLCSAWWDAPDLRKVLIHQSEWMSPEIASALSIAIGMANEWLTEQI